MRRRTLLAGIAGIGAAGGVYGAASVLTSNSASGDDSAPAADGSPAESNGSDSDDPGSAPGSDGSTADGDESSADGDEQNADGDEPSDDPPVDAYEPVGTVDVEGARELVTSEDGSVAYLAVDDGIASIDLSTPASPTVLDQRRGLLADDPDGPLQLVWDVSVAGDRLLAAGPAIEIPGSALQAALLFDVADPNDLQLLDSFRTSYPIHNCFFDGDAGYLTANGEEGNPLVILDAGDDELTEAGRWSILEVDEAWSDVSGALRTLHDVVVQDDVAYLAYWDAGTYLVDVADPADPAYLGHTSVFERSELAELDRSGVVGEYTAPPGNDHFVQPGPSGHLFAVSREAWAYRDGDCVRGGAGGVDLYDARDPTAIEHLATIDPPPSYDQTQGGPFTTAHNVDIRDGRLYTAWYFGGVKVHDVDDPASPEEIAWWRQPEEACFWTARSAAPGEHFVASSAGDAAGFDDSIAGGVYVFPDRAGEQPDPPDLTESPTTAVVPDEC